MARGEKPAINTRQKRQREQLTRGYRKRGLSSTEAARRASETIHQPVRGKRRRSARR